MNVARIGMAEPQANGRFGDFGGRYVPESLMPACFELEAAFRSAWADPEFPRAVPRPAGGLRRPADAGHRMRPAVRAARRPAAAQAGGPHPHRVAQDQQRHRPGPADLGHGQAAHHRRDRRRSARGGHRHRGRPVRPANASSTWARWTPSARPSTCSGCKLLGAEVRTVRSGQPHAEGCRQRGHAGLGGVGGRHPLLPRVGDGTAPLPVDGAGVPAHRRRRSPEPVPRSCSTGPTPTTSSPASAEGPTRRGPSPASSTPRPG